MKISASKITRYTMYCVYAQVLEVDNVDSVAPLTTLACWQLVQFVPRRSARTVPRSSAPRPCRVDTRAMVSKERKNVYHVCTAARLQSRMMRMKLRINCVI